MTWKKSWFSYVLWMFYSFIICISLSLSIVLLFSQKLNQFIIIGVVCLFFLMLTGLFFLFRHISDADFKPRKWIERFLIFAGIGLGILGHYLIISGVDVEKLEQSSYFVNSFVGNTYSVPKVLYRAEWGFLQGLRYFFALVGNHVRAALWMQVFLQIFSGLILLHTLRKVFGRITSICCFWGFVFLSIMFSAQLYLQPVWFVVFLFVIGFFSLVNLLYTETKDRKHNNQKRFLNYFKFVLLGLYFGIIIYLDIYGIILVFLSIGMLWRVSLTSNDSSKIFSRPISLLCLLFGVIVGIISLFYWESWYCQISFVDVVMDWQRLYSLQMDNLAVLGYSINEIVLFMVCCSVLFWGILFFFRETETDALRPVFILLLSVASLHILGIGVYNSIKIWLFVLLMICAAICLETCFASSKKKETIMQAEAKTVEALVEESERKGQENFEKADVIDEVKTKRKLLENPLPGPKKHVSKVLDYDLDESNVADSLWNYDLEVSENDDFDIK